MTRRRRVSSRLNGGQAELAQIGIGFDLLGEVDVEDLLEAHEVGSQADADPADVDVVVHTFSQTLRVDEGLPEWDIDLEQFGHRLGTGKQEKLHDSLGIVLVDGRVLGVDLRPYAARWVLDTVTSARQHEGMMGFQRGWIDARDRSSARIRREFSEIGCVLGRRDAGGDADSFERDDRCPRP
jgi:hypothetical protein